MNSLRLTFFFFCNSIVKFKGLSKLYKTLAQELYVDFAIGIYVVEFVQNFRPFIIEFEWIMILRSVLILKEILNG